MDTWGKKHDGIVLTTLSACSQDGYNLVAVGHKRLCTNVHTLGHAAENTLQNEAKKEEVPLS